MSDAPEQLKSHLAQRYRIERELGSGGMATVAPGGNRFLFLRMANGGRRSQLTVVENWTEELKHLRKR